MAGQMTRLGSAEIRTDLKCPVEKERSTRGVNIPSDLLTCVQAPTVCSIRPTFHSIITHSDVSGRTGAAV